MLLLLQGVCLLCTISACCVRAHAGQELGCKQAQPGCTHHFEGWNGSGP